MRHRLPDWEKRLHQYLLEAMTNSIPGAETPLEFSWDTSHGMHCITWVCGGIHSVIGENPYQDFGSHLQFGSAIGAQRAMIDMWKVHTVRDLVALFFEPRLIVKVQTGDIGLVRLEEPTQEMVSAGQEVACGIVSAPYVYLIGPGGVIREPIDHLVEVFAVDSYKGPPEKEVFG